MQTVPERHSNSGQLGFDESSRRYQALLHSADLAAQCTFPELLKEISKSVHDLFPFEFLNYALYSSSRNSMVLRMLGGDAEPVWQPTELPVDGCPSGWVWSNQRSLILSEGELESRFPVMRDFFTPHKVRSLLALPMTTGRGRLGALVFGSAQSIECDEGILSFLTRITGLVALAIENSISKETLAREAEKLEALAEINTKLAALNARTHDELQEERDRLKTLVEINATLLGGKLSLEEMLPAVAKCISKSIPHEAAAVSLWHEAEACFEVHSLEAALNRDILHGHGWRTSAEESFRRSAPVLHLQTKQLSQPLCLRAADWDFRLLFIIHAELV